MFKAFSPDFKKFLYDEIDRLVATLPKPHYAAFDADGTLWDFDLGECFFNYQIKNCNLNLPKAPFQYYLDLKEKSHQQAYLWLAQINQNKNIQQVRQWAEDCVVDYGNLPVFGDMKDLIHHLQSLDVKVFVVTASVKWAVEPGAKRLNIPMENVLGIQTKIINGIVSDQQEGEITYREGKAEAILAATQGISPILCAGNTMGDYCLLEASQGIRLAVGSHGLGEDNYETEQELATIAQEKNWLVHRFRN